MASGIEKMMAAKAEEMLGNLLGVSPEELRKQVTLMQTGVTGLFETTARQERKLDAILLRAGYSAEQIAELNNGGPGNGDGGAG